MRERGETARSLGRFGRPLFPLPALYYSVLHTGARDYDGDDDSDECN